MSEMVEYVDLPEFEVAAQSGGFRNQVLKGQYEAAIKAFNTHHRDLVRIDRRNGKTYQHNGNAWAQHFWRGFNGVHSREHYKGMLDTPAYACWKAGRSIRASISKAL